MSAYICSDKHFAVVAKAMFADLYEQQQFANHLKRENIKSVNYRYGEKTRFSQVNLEAAKAADVRQYNGHDIHALLNCIDYQSCEHPDYDSTMYKLATRLLSAQGSNPKAAQPGLRSI
jgi:hypothetical protein